MESLLRRAVGGLIGLVKEGRIGPAQSVVHQAAQFIRAHCREELRLETVAAAVHVSPFYLSYLFRRQMGTTFLEYLTQARLEEAQRLLQQGELSVTEVGLAVGYHDLAHFRRLFQRQVGVLPSRYRRQGHRAASDKTTP